MSEPSKYVFEGQDVRVVVDAHGEPRFVAKDVAEALGYVWNGTARVAHVPEEWRGKSLVSTSSGAQEMTVLTEAGLGFFLLRSDKPGALPMQRWLASDVLPSIRRTGVYAGLPVGAQFARHAIRSLVDGAADAVSYLYFIRQGLQGPVKVGRSTDVVARVKSLQTGSAEPLVLLGVVPEAGPLTESALHERLSNYRLCGEWFTATPEVLACINEVLAGCVR